MDNQLSIPKYTVDTILELVVVDILKTVGSFKKFTKTRTNI